MGSFTNRNRYPEPGHAGQLNRDADLRCKASFDRLEQRPAFPNVAVRPRERQRNERHESEAADPVGDEHCAVPPIRRSTPMHTPTSASQPQSSAATRSPGLNGGTTFSLWCGEKWRASALSETWAGSW